MKYLTILLMSLILLSACGEYSIIEDKPEPTNIEVTYIQNDHMYRVKPDIEKYYAQPIMEWTPKSNTDMFCITDYDSVSCYPKKGKDNGK